MRVTGAAWGCIHLAVQLAAPPMIAIAPARSHAPVQSALALALAFPPAGTLGAPVTVESFNAQKVADFQQVGRRLC